MAPAALAPIEERLLGWLIDVAIVAVLVAAVYVFGLIRIGGCEPYDEVKQQFPASCAFSRFTEVTNDDGKTDIVYVLDDGRLLPAKHPILFGDRIVDPPGPSTYLAGLGYVLVMWVLVQGITGWTPGRLLTRTRLVGEDRRPLGPPRALGRWLVVDGGIGLVGIAAGLLGWAWPIRLLAANAALGVLGGLATMLVRSPNHMKPADHLLRSWVVSARGALPTRRTDKVEEPSTTTAAMPSSVWSPTGDMSAAVEARAREQAIELPPVGDLPVDGPGPLAAPIQYAKMDSRDAPSWPEATTPAQRSWQESMSAAIGIAPPAALAQPPETTSERSPDIDPAHEPEVEPATEVERNLEPAALVSSDAMDPVAETTPAVAQHDSIAPQADRLAPDKDLGERFSPREPGSTRLQTRAPEWDPVRAAYIFWDGRDWLQYDYARQLWGPISR